MTGCRPRLLAAPGPRWTTMIPRARSSSASCIGSVSLSPARWMCFIHLLRWFATSEFSFMKHSLRWSDEDYDAPGVEAVVLRRGGLLVHVVRQRVRPGGIGASQRHGRQPLRLLPVQRRPQVHRLRRPHGRATHPSGPVPVRPARRIQGPLIQQKWPCCGGIYG